MKMLTPDQVRRIYDVTDSLGLHRQWVVLPLATSDRPCELLLPDGKLLVTVPADAAFETWFAGLPGRLARLDLTRVPKTDHREPSKRVLLADSPPGAEAPPFSYTQDIARGN